jgi:hypothetical protein
MRSDLLHAAINKLRGNKKTVIQLFFFETRANGDEKVARKDLDYRLKEIGDILGVSKERVRQIKLQAIDDLRKILIQHKDDLVENGDTLSGIPGAMGIFLYLENILRFPWRPVVELTRNKAAGRLVIYGLLEVAFSVFIWDWYGTQVAMCTTILVFSIGHLFGVFVWNEKINKFEIVSARELVRGPPRAKTFFASLSRALLLALGINLTALFLLDQNHFVAAALVFLIHPLLNLAIAHGKSTSLGILSAFVSLLPVLLPNLFVLMDQLGNSNLSFLWQCAWWFSFGFGILFLIRGFEQGRLQDWEWPSRWVIIRDLVINLVIVVLLLGVRIASLNIPDKCLFP